VVVDAAYPSAPVVVDEVGPDYSGLPAFFTPGLVFASRVPYALDVGSAVPTDVVRAHPERRFLFIHCEDDHTVAMHHGVDLKNASANPDTELWLVKDCGQVKAFITHPQASLARSCPRVARRRGEITSGDRCGTATTSTCSSSSSR
jgi:fermentation-respiration switch protein FrsA (DUF1100 family)